MPIATIQFKKLQGICPYNYITFGTFDRKCKYLEKKVVNCSYSECPVIEREK